MKPFDLKRALAGDPVITGCGIKIIELKYFENVPEDTLYPVVAFHKGDYKYSDYPGDGKYEISSYTRDGKFDYNQENCNLDLFMASNEKKLYIVVGTNKNGNNQYDTTVAFESRSEAIEAKKRLGTYYAEIVEVIIQEGV